MTITYIHHSGYLLETEQALLLFDFVEGALPPLDPAKDLFVFVSHRHEDHFSPKIFDLAATHPRIRFILSDDIWQNKVPEHLARPLLVHGSGKGSGMEGRRRASRNSLQIYG